MKKGMIFTLAFRIMGIAVLVFGIRIVGAGVWNYINEHQQKDWIAVDAQVVDISSRYSGSATRGRRVNYVITYQYEVNGETYSDTLYNRSRAMALGDAIPIQYDPDAPEKSTEILSPSLHNLTVFLIFGILLTIAGYFLSGAWALIRRMRRRGRPEEEEILPPEEYVEPEAADQVPKRPAVSILCRTFVILLALGAAFLWPRLFPADRAAGIERFREAAQERGFTTADTTDELRQSWKVGSMLKESASLNDGNIRMDVCKMDTADSAQVLYGGMTLPVPQGEEQQYSQTAYERYSVEDDTLYTAKIRLKDTVVYVSAKAEYKAEAVEWLEELGYWKQ